MKKLKLNQSGLTGILEILLITVVLGVLGFIGWRVWQAKHSKIVYDGVQTSSEAIAAGRQLTNNKCEGEGVPYKLSASPMEAEDFSIVIPYGLMVGGHVTPIDHQYFAPVDYRSARDSYEVYAMADSRIVEIQPRVKPQGTEYRFVFSVSCTFLYYYDLVTSLAPDVQQAYDAAQGGFSRNVDIPVKAGQLVGRIGGQTLDFAVWDTTKPLSRFVVPEHYVGENWKIYTADPLDYYTDELKALVVSRYVRTAEPISGKIDYDIDGRLIGNWFLEGSNGYGGGGQGENYFTGHLAFAPDHYDPTHFVISIGSLYKQLNDDENMQFMAASNEPDPKEVSIATGLVKYDLVHWSYLKTDGSPWDRNSLTKGVEVSTAGQPIVGCVLVQMLENRKLKFEAFPGKTAAQVSGFSTAAKIYER